MCKERKEREREREMRIIIVVVVFLGRRESNRDLYKYIFERKTGNLCIVLLASSKKHGDSN